jgi:hypothetical protein
MSTAFKTYEAAFNAAVRKAREHVEAGLASEQCEMGLERNALFREWTIRMLPLPKNRYGSDLRCQVVRASDPLMKEG